VFEVSFASDHEECLSTGIPCSDSFPTDVVVASKLSMGIVPIGCAFKGNGDLAARIRAGIVVMFQFRNRETITYKYGLRVFDLCVTREPQRQPVFADAQ